MVLRKVIKENYIMLVEPGKLGIDIVSNIISPLKEYAVFCRGKGYENRSGAEERAFNRSVVEGRILAINGELEMSILRNTEGKDLSVIAEFRYVEDTPKEDLEQVRQAITASGLEPITGQLF